MTRLGAGVRAGVPSLTGDGQPEVTCASAIDRVAARGGAMGRVRRAVQLLIRWSRVRIPLGSFGAAHGVSSAQVAPTPTALCGRMCGSASLTQLRARLALPLLTWREWA